jgi:hypothetical protein
LPPFALPLATEVFDPVPVPEPEWDFVLALLTLVPERDLVLSPRFNVEVPAVLELDAVIEFGFELVEPEPVVPIDVELVAGFELIAFVEVDAGEDAALPLTVEVGLVVVLETLEGVACNFAVDAAAEVTGVVVVVEFVLPAEVVAPPLAELAPEPEKAGEIGLAPGPLNALGIALAL